MRCAALSQDPWPVTLISALRLPRASRGFVTVQRHTLRLRDTALQLLVRPRLASTQSPSAARHVCNCRPWGAEAKVRHGWGAEPELLIFQVPCMTAAPGPRKN